MPDNGPATITVIREAERPVVDFVGGATYRLWGIIPPEPKQRCSDGWDAAAEASPGPRACGRMRFQRRRHRRPQARVLPRRWTNVARATATRQLIPDTAAGLISGTGVKETSPIAMS